MKRTHEETPEAAMRRVTVELVRRAIRYSRRRRRPIFISKTSGGRGVEVTALDPRSPEGRERLERFLTPVKRQYTISGLGRQEDPGSVNWRNLNMPWGRRVLKLLQVACSLFMKGTPRKNRWLRWMGVHVGRGAEVMQMVWLDHFRPELIFIGDDTLLGAFTQVTVHGYEGAGRFRYGLVEIGARCTLGAGTGVGPVKVGDGVRTLPGTKLSPYFARVPEGAVVGFNRPPLEVPAAKGADASPDATPDDDAPSEG
jgi:Hexapeptide repeat of succinyl-transferase